MYYNYCKLLVIVGASLFIWSCNNDLPEPEKPSTDINTNANKSNFVEASRLEIPKLKDGEENQFIVKKAKLRDNRTDMFVNFCIEYDLKKRSSRWTAFRWDIDNTYDSNCGRAGDFMGDPDIISQYRVEGYFKGYQRGHMLASEDRQCSVDANKQTFYMTNMQPQYGRFNGYDNNGSYVWVNTEQLVRKLYGGWTKTYNATDTIYVVKGGTIDNSSNILGYTSCGSTNNIIVPKYFYMALLYKTGKSQTQGGYKAIALWIPHTEGNTTAGKDIAWRYAISIDELEEKTGIDFFCNMPDNLEKIVESNYNLAAWGWQ
jgi:endonuclease G